MYELKRRKIMYHKDESWIADKEVPEGVLDPTRFLLEAEPPIEKLELN